MAGVTTEHPPWLAPSSQPDPPGAQRRRRWLAAGLAGWIVVLLVVTYVSVRRDDPTVREQRSIEQAGPVVDRAIGDLVAAAGPDVVVELAERRVRDDCEVTLLRKGAAIDAAITIRSPEAEAPECSTGSPAGCRGVPGGCPTSRRRRRGRAAGRCRRVRRDRGRVRRTGSGEPDRADRLPAGLRHLRRPVDTAAVAGRRGPGPGTHRAGGDRPRPGGPDRGRLPGQGTVRTARSAGRTTATGPPGALLPRPAGTVVVTDTPQVYAYRAGAVSVVVESGDGRIRVATTTGCPS